KTSPACLSNLPPLDDRRRQLTAVDAERAPVPFVCRPGSLPDGEVRHMARIPGKQRRTRGGTGANWLGILLVRCEDCELLQAAVSGKDADLNRTPGKSSIQKAG